MYTDSDGFYASYELPGVYKIVAEKAGYSFPSTKITMGVENLDNSSNIGGHGQSFILSSDILRIDIPMDKLPDAPMSSGGGSPILAKDKCNYGDYSSSYYDANCRPIVTFQKEVVTEKADTPISDTSRLDIMAAKLSARIDPFVAKKGNAYGKKLVAALRKEVGKGRTIK